MKKLFAVVVAAVMLAGVTAAQGPAGKVKAAVNGDSSTAAAVKVGKQLGVSYVLTGHVTDYAVTGKGGSGQATLRYRLVEVATGAVKHSGEIAQKAAVPMLTTGDAEVHTKVFKPAFEKMTEALAGKF